MNFWLYIASSKKEKKKDWLYNTCYTEFCPCQKKEDAKRAEGEKKVRGQKGKKRRRTRVEKRREEKKETKDVQRLRWLFCAASLPSAASSEQRC
jgi:hypothetical protein